MMAGVEFTRSPTVGHTGTVMLGNRTSSVAKGRVGRTMSRLRAAASGAIFTWSAMTASRGVPAWDAALFRRLNELPDSLAPIVWVPMQAGALAAPLTVAAYLLTRRRRRDACRIGTTGAAAWALAKVVKTQIDRGRPGVHIEQTTLRIGSADHGLGYPSGHAAVSVALAIGLTRHASRSRRLAGVAVVSTVGASRVYVGAHYPLDVIGGFAMGVAIADFYDTVEGVITSTSRRRAPD
jgi:membrane-associated phospholipid phosphatase